jgi:signal peptidase I
LRAEGIHCLTDTLCRGTTAEPRSGPALFLITAAQVLLATIVGLMVCACLPPLVGWRSQVVLSGSMSPALRVGDIVVSRPASVERLTPGQVVVVDNPAQPGRTLVHRLVRVDADGNLVTKGDANTADDSSPIPPSGLKGVGRMRVPYIGLVAVWAQERVFSRLLLGLIILVALGAVATAGRFRRPRVAPAPPPRLMSTGGLDRLRFDLVEGGATALDLGGDAWPQAPVGEFLEPPFDQIQPGAGGRAWH